MQDFEYTAVTYYLSDEDLAINHKYILPLEKNQMTKLSGLTFDQGKDVDAAVLVTEMYDKERGQWGYYVVNVTDPEEHVGIEISMSFEGYENALLVQSMSETNLKLIDGALTLNLDAGCGAFILPY